MTEKECDILAGGGFKTYSGPSYIFSGGGGKPPTSRIYAPPAAHVQANEISTMADLRHGHVGTGTHTGPVL